VLLREDAAGLEGRRDPLGVAAVDRALAIMGAIAGSDGPCTLAAVAAGTGLYKSTILRLLGSLEGGRYVSRLADGRYIVGPAAFTLGRAYDRHNPLRVHARTVLEQLVEQGSESSSFHVHHGPGSRLCLIRVDSRHPTLDRVHEGDILPLDRGAAGRVLLAFSGEPGPVYDRIRAERIAHSSGEREQGCAAMASPVFAPDGRLAGALSLSGPRDRFSAAMRSTWGPRVVRAAAELTDLLGGSFPEGRP
jgi:DNA-binding IclR family transcriptional regulator